LVLRTLSPTIDVTLPPTPTLEPTPSYYGVSHTDLMTFGTIYLIITQTLLLFVCCCRRKRVVVVTGPRPPPHQPWTYRPIDGQQISHTYRK
jgi:hypothetical protein